MTLHALRVIEERLRDVGCERQQPGWGIVVLGGVLPEQRLAHPVALTLGTGVLKRGVHDVRVETDLLVHPLDEVGVAAREHADRKDAHFQLAVVARD